MMRALLYCAGVGVRWARGWPDGLPKQLAPVEGEPLLDRTIRQLIQRGVEPIVVAFDDRLRRDGAGFWTPPRETRWLVETISLSEDVCDSSRTIGLFGDACMTDRAMDLICQSSGLKFFGREKLSYLTGGPGECFGWAMDFSDHGRFFGAIQAGVQDAAAKDAGPHGTPTEPGAIWQPYRLLCGFDPYDHRVDGEMWVEIDDWSDDFDTPERYRVWTERYMRRWLKDSG